MLRFEICFDFISLQDSTELAGGDYCTGTVKGVEIGSGSDVERVREARKTPPT